MFQLRTFIALEGSIPGTHVVAQNLSVTLVIKHPPPSSGFCGFQAYMWYTIIPAGKAIHTHKLKIKSKEH